MSKASERPVWPEDRPQLTPFLPFVLSIWIDGVLDADELAALRTSVDILGRLSESDRTVLKQWMDPAVPPAPVDLGVLRNRVRDASLGDRDVATRSLTALGLALWASEGRGGPWDEGDVVASLHDLERSLSVLGSEAARRMLGLPSGGRAATSGRPIGDSSVLRSVLEDDHELLRQRVRALLGRPELSFTPAVDHVEYREQVLEAVRLLADEGLGRIGYPPEYGGQGDAGGAVAVFETLAFGDLSVLVKFGVQFGLFGGSVHQLGTARHHEKYLERIGSLELPGCYAMTETLHGSDVRSLQTTAEYDRMTSEIVINTPEEGAGKDYIGNAAAHGQLATVFARLIVDGDDHGIHAVLVPIRGPEGTPSPGVRIVDRGRKVGLNGVDNGRIWFDHVRVPAENLLDRFGSVDESGRYHSSIPSAGRRFFTMLRTLVAGRVSIAAASVSATKVGLRIAVKHVATRRQFGPSPGVERPLLDYLLVQRELLPRLATTYGLHFSSRRLQAYFSGKERGEGELEVRAAALKAYASDHCVASLQACREACGGLGYIEETGFAALKDDTDVFTTFEGANNVLYQLVARGLLSRFKDEMGDLDLWGALKYLGERAETSLTELNPVATRRTDVEHLMNPDFHRSALAYREERLLRTLAGRIRARLRDEMNSFDAVNEVQDHLVTLARSHAEWVVLEDFQRACTTAPTGESSQVLGDLCALYALTRIEADRGWFMEAGYFEPNKSRAIRAQINELCHELSDRAVELVEAFHLPDSSNPEPDKH
jgi:acyl-CoA oxidase